MKGKWIKNGKENYRGGGKGIKKYEGKFRNKMKMNENNAKENESKNAKEIYWVKGTWIK